MSRTIEDVKKWEKTAADKDAQLAQSETLKAELDSAREQASQQQQEIASHKTSLDAQKATNEKIQILERDLIQARNELLLYQTAAQTLGTADSRNASGAVKSHGTVPPGTQQPSARALAIRARAQQAMLEQGKTAAREDLRRPPHAALASKNQTPSDAQPAASGSASDVLILEVKSSKVNLRSGPGEEHSPIMQVRQGVRLTVEDREGSWFRVITPTAGRAYIHEDVVRVISGTLPPSQPQLEASIPSAPSAVVAPSAPNAPGVPAVRAIRDEGVVPFGDTKLSAGSGDIEAIALDRLRSGLEPKQGNKDSAGEEE